MHKAYADDTSRRTMDLFKLRVTSRARGVVSSSSASSSSSATTSTAAMTGTSGAPVVLVEDVSFVYVNHKDLYLVAATTANANAPLILAYLSQLIVVLQAYLGPNFDEVAVRNNFSLVYELLDETIDYGVPQNCAVDVLKLYVNTGSDRGGASAGASAIQAAQLTEQITGKTDWRRPDIVYKKNELYVDVLESVNVLIGSDGVVLRADVSGEIKLRSFLSGMPECKVSLNDRLAFAQGSFMVGGPGVPVPASGSSTARTADSSLGVGAASTTPEQNPPTAMVDIDDVSFHRCVRLGKYDADRSIIFVPPDGVFELMRYRVSQNVSLPFRVIPIVEQTKTRVAYNIRVSCNFSSKVSAHSIVVKVPVPPNTFKVNAVCSFGKAKFEPGESAMVWRVRAAVGGQELYLNGVAELAQGTKEKPWSRPPITLAFRVNMYTSSNLFVSYVRVVEASNYPVGRFVRYVTRNGTYAVRF